MKKDVEAGVMQEYNLKRMLDGVDKDNSYMYDLMLNFTVPRATGLEKAGMSMASHGMRSCWIYWV